MARKSCGPSIPKTLFQPEAVLFPGITAFKVFGGATKLVLLRLRALTMLSLETVSGSEPRIFWITRPSNVTPALLYKGEEPAGKRAGSAFKPARYSVLLLATAHLILFTHSPCRPQVLKVLSVVI
jgi:hypothetical protein